MLIYLADLAHTYSTKNESLMIPLNIGYLKAYAMEQHKDKIEIKLFKDPQKLLLYIGDKNPDLVGFANYGWNADLNFKVGNYIKSKNAISVTGSWTLEPRKGRLVQILKTLRWTRDGWINKLGLRNPGILDAISNHKDNEVLSIASINEGDWHELHKLITKDYSVELNLSCPNVDESSIEGAELFLSSNKRKWLICKVSPLITETEIDYLLNLGFTQIHASNTIPVEKGGLSGKSIIPHTLRILLFFLEKISLRVSNFLLNPPNHLFQSQKISKNLKKSSKK